MNKYVSRLTVLFEEPFWIGLYERWDGGRYEACKITFGAEPKDYEVYDFMLKNWHSLRFGPALNAAVKEEHRVNPKRMRRLINKHIKTGGVGTKAQQALKLQQEESKTARKVRSREIRDLEKEHRFDLRRQKRKEKHKGH